MGGAVERISPALSFGTQCDVADLTPLPDGSDCIAPPSYTALDDKHRQNLIDYLSSCHHALQAHEWSEKALRWVIPADVVLSCACGSAAACEEGARKAFHACAMELGDRLCCLSLRGHEEVTAVVVQSLLPRLWRSSPLASPALTPLRCGLVVLDFTGCALGDAGVKALLLLLFPSSAVYRTSAESTATSAVTRREDRAVSDSKGSRATQENAWRLLPCLRALCFDAVGLTDAGAADLATVLESVARREDPCSSSSRGRHAGEVVVSLLSLRRNRLSAHGIVRALRTSLDAGKAKTSPHSSAVSARPLVAAVDVSWNSTAPLRGGERAVQDKAAGWASLGAALFPPSFVAAPESDAASFTPPRSTSLVLQGCDLQPADVEALWVNGLVATFAQRFREAGKAALPRLSDPNANLPAPSMPAVDCIVWTSITRIDLSHNTAMGSAGVLHLLAALASLEMARRSTMSQRHPHGLVAHPLTALEELRLRDVGCGDAVLPAVLRLLLGDERLISGVLRKGEGSLQQLHGGRGERSTAEGSATAAVLRAEVNAFANLQAQETPKMAVVSDVPLSTRLPLPHLRLLDLSSNRFSSSVLIAAVVSAVLLRCSATQTASRPSVVVEGSGTQGTNGASRAGEDNGAVSDAAEDAVPCLLALEGCALSDAALDAVPRIVAESTESLAKEQERMGAVVATRHFTSCALLLGYNALTHDAVLRLRRWAHLHSQREDPDRAAGTTSATTSIGRTRVVAYVEGNAVVHPALDARRVACCSDGEGVAGAEGLSTCSFAAGAADAMPLPFGSQPLLSPHHPRVDWNTLSPLPPPAANSAVSHAETSHTRSTPHAHSSTPSQPLPSRVAARHRRKKDTGRPSASPSVASPSSPAFSADPEAYIDEFIAEAERVMSERAYAVGGRMADGSEVADMLLEHAGRTSRGME